MTAWPHRPPHRRRSREEIREVLREVPEIHFSPHEVDYLHHDIAHTLQGMNDPWDLQEVAGAEEWLPEEDDAYDNPDRPPKRDVWT